MAAGEPSLPPGYPQEWEADVLLADGRSARLRPIRPDDAPRLVDFYARVSAESKYLRFFAPYPRLSARDVTRFTQVDYVDRVALILTLGEQMIAVSRYDRLADYRAEVAFLVEDAHQGRGVAQLLLEHLAEAARERGITAFVAEVLPQNRRMANVFVDAGYRVTRRLDDGVLQVEFPILPTTTFLGVMERREHRAERLSIQRLLRPECVVVQGPGERAQRLVDSLLGGGFRGTVTAVSTDGVALRGVSTSPSLAEVAGRIDLAVLAVASGELASAVIDAAAKGAHGLVLLAGSSGEPSRAVVGLARSYGVRAVGPDALGLINTDPAVALNASLGPMPRPGGAGLFCQSPAVGVSLLNAAVRGEVGISSFISTGDYADVTGNDVMQYWEDDERTRLCLLSLDSLGNPRKFSRIVRRLARCKPIVVVSPDRARRSWSAPDAAAGKASQEAVDAMFRQAGVIVVHRWAAMFDIAQILSRQPLPAGPRVQVLSNARSLARALTHEVRAVGLLPAADPVVLAADVAPEVFAAAARTALRDDRCDTVVCGVLGAVGPSVRDVGSELERVAGEGRKPVVAVTVNFAEEPAPPDPGSKGRPEHPDELGSLPWFDSATDAVTALAAVSAYAHWRERDPGAVPLLDVDEDAARRVVNRALADTPGGRDLREPETAELLGAFGIRVVSRRVVANLTEAIEAGEAYGWNVVLKAGAAVMRGRPDAIGVYRNLAGPEQMRAAWRDLVGLVVELGLGDPGLGDPGLGDPGLGDPGLGDPGLGEEPDLDLQLVQPVVQPMVPPGVPLVVNSREDPAFGPILSLGLAGIASELLGDVVYRVPPLTTADAAAMVRDLRTAPELFGRSGKPGANVPAVEDLLHRVAQLTDLLPQLRSVTLSPCLAGRRVLSVLSARVAVAPYVVPRDPLARTLD